VYGYISTGNFNKFIRTLQQGKKKKKKKYQKLVSRHKELFRKRLTFQATPKKSKILYIQ
jgi:hypothetical protein